jgi:multiple sugar transport system permease protein
MTAQDMVGPAAQARDAVTRLGRSRPRRHQGPRPLATAVIWLSVVYFLLPIVYLLVAATKSNQEQFSTPGLSFGSSFELFTNIWNAISFDSGIFLRWLGNSFGYAIVGALGATVLATLAGYGLAKYRFPGKAPINIVIMGAVMVPATAIALPTFLLFAKIGLVNTPLAVILPSMSMPFAVFLMREYTKAAVDQELVEAARIDGAGEFRIFWQVSLPLLAPGAATVVLFAFVTSFNNYFLPLLMLNKTELLPITVGLSQWYGLAAGPGAGKDAVEYIPMMMAGSVISLVPLIFIFLYLQRYWQSGLATGAVKG